MEELKPCPFCGEEPLIFFGDETRWEGDLEGWVIGCITENCKGHISLSWSFWGFDGKEKAITAWNTRAERTCTNTAANKDDFCCSECTAYAKGAMVDDFDCWVSVGNAFSRCPSCGAKVVR